MSRETRQAREDFKHACAEQSVTIDGLWLIVTKVMRQDQISAAEAWRLLAKKVRQGGWTNVRNPRLALASRVGVRLKSSGLPE